MKTGINQVKYYHAVIAKVANIELKYKHNQGFNQALLKGLVTHNINANHHHKIKQRKRIKPENRFLESRKFFSKIACIKLCVEFYGLEVYL
jgi:phage gp16-like protein